MAKRSKKDDHDDVSATPAEGPGHHGGDASLVLSISLLIGGVVSYPAMSAAAEGTGDLMKALTLFLAVTLVASIGVGINVMLFRSFSRDDDEAAEHDADTTAAGESAAAIADPGNRFAIEHELSDQVDAIDDALAATDALVHERP
jgi:hypothetical protein